MKCDIVWIQKNTDPSRVREEPCETKILLPHSSDHTFSSSDDEYFSGRQKIMALTMQILSKNR